MTGRAGFRSATIGTSWRSSPSTLNRMLDSLERARATERRFLADASHELRTPLTSLRGNAAYVAQHGADAAALEDIEADVARLARLLDDLLALEREDGATRPTELVDLGEVIDAVCAGQPDVEVTIAAEVVVHGEPGRSSGRCATSSRTPASTAHRTRRSPFRWCAPGHWRCSRCPIAAPACPRTRSTPRSSASGAGRRPATARVRVSGCRS